MHSGIQMHRSRFKMMHPASHPPDFCRFIGTSKKSGAVPPACWGFLVGGLVVFDHACAKVFLLFWQNQFAILGHTQLTHTQLSNTQLTHTQLTHTHTQLSHTHNLPTHNLHTHTTLSHSQLSHTQLSHTHNLLTHTIHSQTTYTQLTHTQLTHTHNCVAGVALGDIGLHSAWQRWNANRHGQNMFFWNHHSLLMPSPSSWWTAVVKFYCEFLACWMVAK